MKQLLGYADILAEASCYLGYLWMADKFCKKYLETSKKKELLFVIISFGGWLLLNIAGRRCPFPSIFLMVLHRILFMGLILLLFRAEGEKKILAGSILMAAMTLAGNFFTSFLSCLMLFFRHTVKKVPEPFLSGWETGVSVCLSLCLVILAVYWLSKRLVSVFYDKPEKWYVILATPLLVMTAMSDVVNWGASNGIMVRSGGNMGLYYDQIFSHVEICLLAGLSMFGAGVYVFGMNQIYLEQEKSSRYHSQIAVYKMLAEEYRQSERLRHDMKNHIIALSGLFQDSEWEKMGDYLENMKGGSLESGGEMTGNKAVDALLYQKQKWAEREKIKWECDVQILKTCGINEFDLCVLFGNTLDNALEACERQRCGGNRFVNIQARAVKKCFFIEVKNSMDMAEKYENRFKDKEKSSGHGIGLLNVNDVVDKYNGAVEREVQNGIFVISILIPLNEYRT